MLSASQIEKSYESRSVLRGIDLEIAKGEIVSITGASGAGKSTLLHILGTLDTADKGKININGTDVTALNGKKLASFRNKHIGFVFQFHHLLPEFTALENVCIPGWIAKRKNKEVETRAMELLNRLKLDKVINQKPSEMSGGEQQRVAVARSLINAPSIIMADEPTGNLDSANAEEMHKLFSELRDEFQQTFLIVTHNDALAAMSDRVMHMRDGLMV